MRQLFRSAVWEAGYRAPQDWVSAGLIGLQVVGGLASAGAQLQQGEAAKQWASYNQAVLNQMAAQRRAEAAARADIIQRTSGRKIGAIKSAYGAAGVDIQGTPLDVLADQASEFELERQLALYQGEAEAASLTQRGMMMQFQGQMAMDAAETSAGTTLLTTLAGAGMNAYNASTTGGGSKVPTISRGPSTPIQV